MTTPRIRKEIRDLPQSEWNDVAAAMWIMKKTSDADGIRKYGKWFVNYDTMVAMHMNAALDPRGDQAHFGPTLGIFHRCWLLRLENSLLAINSRIKGLPYWDYTRDKAPLNKKYKSIFGSDYMGSYVGKGKDYAVTNGKFKNWPISRGQKHGPIDRRNCYGWLRHPVSCNPSPYLTRNGGKVCGYPLDFGDITMWDTCLQTADDNILNWTSCVDSNIHGPAHSAIAGSWRRDGQYDDAPNCVQWYGFIDAPPKAKIPADSGSVLDSVYPYGTFISPWALGCFTQPKCDLSQNPSECMCTPADSCGPLWTKLRDGNTPRKGGRNIDTSAFSTLAPADNIQICGDLGDPVGSPNDPM